MREKIIYNTSYIVKTFVLFYEHNGDNTYEDGDITHIMNYNEISSLLISILIVLY